MINQMKKYKDKILQILTLITENKKLPSLLLVCEITSHIMKNILNKIKLYIILKPNQAYLVMLITYFIMRASIAYCDILSDIAWWLGTGSSDSTGSDNSSDNSSESTSSGSDTELDDTIIPYLPQIIIDAAAWVGGIENLEDSTSSSDSSSDTSSNSTNTDSSISNPNYLVSLTEQLIEAYRQMDLSKCQSDNSKIYENIRFVIETLPKSFFAQNKEELENNNVLIDLIIEKIHCTINFADRSDIVVKANLEATLRTANTLQFFELPFKESQIVPLLYYHYLSIIYNELIQNMSSDTIDTAVPLGNGDTAESAIDGVYPSTQVYNTNVLNTDIANSDTDVNNAHALHAFTIELINGFKTIDYSKSPRYVDVITQNVNFILQTFPKEFFDKNEEEFEDGGFLLDDLIAEIRLDKKSDINLIANLETSLRTANLVQLTPNTFKNPDNVVSLYEEYMKFSINQSTASTSDLENNNEYPI